MSSSFMAMDSTQSSEYTGDEFLNKTNFALKTEKKETTTAAYEERDRLNFLKVLKHFHDTRGFVLIL